MYTASQLLETRIEEWITSNQRECKGQNVYAPERYLSPYQPPAQTKERENTQSTEYDDDDERLTHSGIKRLQGGAGPVNPSRCASILVPLRVKEAVTGDEPPICVTARGPRTCLPPSNDFPVSLSKDPDPEVHIRVGEPRKDGPNNGRHGQLRSCNT